MEVNFNRPSSRIPSQIFDFHKRDLINRKHNINVEALYARNKIQAKYLFSSLETD